jgi:hypothetical protein
MDYKVKLTKYQNEHHHRGVFDTWTKWTKPQPKSLAGQPGFESAQPRTWLTCLYIGSQGRIRGLKVVEAEMSGWPATWMAGRPVVHLLQINLAKSVETPLCPYISPPTTEDSTTHTIYSSPLVKALV